MNIEINNNIIAGGNNQNEILFILGNAISGAPNHDWNHPVGKTTDQSWHHHEEDHDQAVRCGKHIEQMRVRKILHARILQFHTHRDGKPTTNDTGDNCKDQVKRTNIFMVG